MQKWLVKYWEYSAPRTLHMVISLKRATRTVIKRWKSSDIIQIYKKKKFKKKTKETRKGMLNSSVFDIRNIYCKFPNIGYSWCLWEVHYKPEFFKDNIIYTLCIFIFYIIYFIGSEMSPLTLSKGITRKGAKKN